MRGKVDRALHERGMIKVDETYSSPVETHNPMEPGTTVAAWDGDHLTVHDATRWLPGAQAILAEVFQLPKGNVRVICPFVGGAFGAKAFRWSSTILAAAAARAAGRPVQIVLTRAQMFTWLGHRPQTRQRITLAAWPTGG